MLRPGGAVRNRWSCSRGSLSEEPRGWIPRGDRDRGARREPFMNAWLGRASSSDEGWSDRGWGGVNLPFALLFCLLTATADGEWLSTPDERNDVCLEWKGRRWLKVEPTGQRRCGSCRYPGTLGPLLPSPSLTEQQGTCNDRVSMRYIVSAES